MQDSDFPRIVALICKEDGRFDRKAYEFVRLGLDHTVKEIRKKDASRSGKSRHVTGPELLDGLRVYALEQYGPLTKTVLNSWGVKKCRDFGDIVFNLIEYNAFSKTENDRREGLCKSLRVRRCVRRSRSCPRSAPRVLPPRKPSVPPNEDSLMTKTHSAPPDRDLLKNAFWREPVERTVLSNGLTLLVKPDRSAELASVQVWVRTGSIHEGSQLGAGLSHYLEHMLFKGTTRRSGREISATVQASGGYINAYTTFDRTVYYIDLPSEHLEVAVDVLADAVLHSTLPEDEVIREKDVILREIAMTRDDPDSRLWEALFAAAFREHPYRHPIIGHRDVFAAVDRKALLDYYHERYVPNNLVVVIAGDVGATEARVSVERHFGQAPRAPAWRRSSSPTSPPSSGRAALHRFEDVEITRAALAWPIPGLTDPSAPVLDILALALGEGDSSILWEEIRDRRRLVHSISASSWNPGSSGLFCISFTCDAGKREEAEKAILRVIRRLAGPRGFTPRQVRKAYRQSVVSEINTCKTMSGQASRLGVAEVVVGDLEFSRTYFERLQDVSPGDLARALRANLVPERLISVSLEPEAGAKPPEVRVSASAARPDFQEVVLANGARIIFQEDRRLPNLHLRLVAHGGPMCEAPQRRGSSALLATLLTKDTRRLSAADVARRIEEVGGSFYLLFRRQHPRPRGRGPAAGHRPLRSAACSATPCFHPRSPPRRSPSSATPSSRASRRKATTWSPSPGGCCVQGTLTAIRSH